MDAPFLIALFGAAFAVQVAYWALLGGGLQRARRRDPAQGPRLEDQLPPLSVVVAARDEEAALPALLGALARQTHPRFEVVIADDASTDGTPQVVQEWIAALPEDGPIDARHVRVADPQVPRKKHALTEGIRAARHPLLAFTDADCRPPPGWLASLARAHAASAPEETAPLLIGYSPYDSQTGRLLERFARYETLLAGLLAAGACGLGRPYMAVGRNLSYARALFEEIGGFAHSQRSMSGDDDLLVQHVARTGAAPVRHVFGPATLVETDAPSTWRAWLKQKRRHASAGRFYRPAAAAHLTVFNLTGALLWLAPLALGWGGLVLLGGKWLAQGAALFAAARAFRGVDLLPALPLWDLLYAAYNVLVVPLGLARLPDEW